jgi:hypothetical protein
MRRALLLLAAIALGGCSSDPEEVVGSPDGAVLIEEGGAPDAASFDGGAGADADADAAPPAEGVVFTDDFTDGDLDDNHWEVVNVCIGCSLDIDQGALVAKTKSVVTQETAFAHLRTTVNGTPSHVRLSFDATFPSVTLTKGTLAIATVDVSQSHFFSLYLRDPDMDAPVASLDEQGGPSPKRHLLTGLPPANTKTRVVIDIDLGGGTASVAFGSTAVLANDPIGQSLAEDPTIRVGLMYIYGPQDPFEARFDDVSLEYF